MTQKLYRAVLIDPACNTVEEIQTPASLVDIERITGVSGGLDHFRLADHEGTWDYGWVDDMGLAAGKPIPAFLFSIRKDPIAGRCLLIGVDKETGMNADAKFDLDILRREITWLGVILPEVVWDETERSSRAIVTYSLVHRRLGKWTVTDMDSASKPGEVYSVVAGFDTQAEAEAYIGEREKIEPENVRRGRYGIDGPEEEMTKR